MDARVSRTRNLKRLGTAGNGESCVSHSTSSSGGRNKIVGVFYGGQNLFFGKASYSKCSFIHFNSCDDVMHETGQPSHSIDFPRNMFLFF